MSDGNRMYGQLVNLRDTAGSQLYRRLVLARKLLEDREWVEDATGGGGDESRALDRLEANCFGDVCGALSLVQMLDLLQHVPEESVWKASKWNLRTIHAEMMERREGKKKKVTFEAKDSPPSTPEERKITKLEEKTVALEEKVTAKMSEIEELRLQLKEANERIRQQDREIARLRKAIKSIQAIQEAIGEVA